MASMAAQWADRKVGELVAEDYGRAAVFQRYGIDFCCGGGRTVGRACEAAGADYEAVSRELTEAAERRSGSQGSGDLRSWDLDALAEHIVARHHAYVRSTLPALRQFTTKLARVHGGRHEELPEIQRLLHELGDELERHMVAEETEVFPRMAALASLGEAGALRDSVMPLEDDHDRAGALLARIRELSGGFRPPADACTTYRVTYATLEEFEADLHRHVHLENNVLFPRALAAAEATGRA
jgi:regulator of cell morphogenesis and NO signaling